MRFAPYKYIKFSELYGLEQLHEVFNFVLLFVFNSGQMLTWLGVVWGAMLAVYIIVMPYPHHLPAVSRGTCCQLIAVSNFYCNVTVTLCLFHWRVVLL